MWGQSGGGFDGILPLRGRNPKVHPRLFSEGLFINFTCSRIMNSATCVHGHDSPCARLSQPAKRRFWKRLWLHSRGRRVFMGGLPRSSLIAPSVAMR
jgi:hypothetical protein